MSIVTLVFVLYCNVFSVLYTAYRYSVFACAVAVTYIKSFCCAYYMSHDILMALCMESEFYEAQLDICCAPVAINSKSTTVVHVGAIANHLQS